MPPILNDLIQRKDINAVLGKLFTYDNYREFMRAYFSEMKKIKNFFSHRYFAQKAGFNSSSFTAHVMDGKRNLTEKSLSKMLNGLGLKGKEAGFFEALVHFNQSKTLDDRERWFRELERIRKSTQFYKVNRKQFAFYDKWYYPVIRELAVYADWNENYAELGRLVKPAVSPDKARKAVETLLEIGLLKRRENGSLIQSSEVLVGDEIPGFVIRKARKEQLMRAMEAGETFGPDERQISSLTLAMGEKSFRRISAEIDQFRRKVLEEVLNDESVDKVYQMSFQLFPLSTKLGKKK